MTRHINIRTKVILSVILFVTLLFGFVEYQNTNKFDRLIAQSEDARNKLLIDTVLPVLMINLSFGLHDANRVYLESIVTQNENVYALQLLDLNGEVVYDYVNPNRDIEARASVVERRILDNVTQIEIGSLRIEFSNLYATALKMEHRNFTYRFLLAFTLFLGVFVLLLNLAFNPLKELLKKIERFDPNKPDERFDVSPSHDEIGIIQNAYAQMTRRIRAYNEERAELTRTLEEKVKERTLKLNEQNKALESANQVLERQICTIRDQEEMLIAQSRLAAMGEMMSMIAHQWRQPIATMSLMITDYDVRSTIEGRERGEVDDILMRISETLGYMSDTVNDFQTYFKPNNALEQAALAQIIERAIHFTQPRLTMYRIDLKIRCDERITIMTYVNELVQVLVNLINNATDAIRERGGEVKDRWIVIEVHEHDSEVTLEVSDSGGGIPESIVGKVFEPYFSTKSKNGTGLGLYMAKMIVEKHGEGKIEVENAKEGAKFSIRFAKDGGKLAPDA